MSKSLYLQNLQLTLYQWVGNYFLSVIDREFIKTSPSLDSGLVFNIESHSHKLYMPVEKLNHK